MSHLSPSQSQSEKVFLHSEAGRRVSCGEGMCLERDEGEVNALRKALKEALLLGLNIHALLLLSFHTKKVRDTFLRRHSHRLFPCQIRNKNVQSLIQQLGAL